MNVLSKIGIKHTRQYLRPFKKRSNSSSGFRTEGSDLSDLEASHTFLIKTVAKETNISLNVFILLYMHI